MARDVVAVGASVVVDRAVVLVGLVAGGGGVVAGVCSWCLASSWWPALSWWLVSSRPLLCWPLF